MANELQVIVQQEPGTVSWNFEQLKESLSLMMQTYENMVYTEDSLAAAKQDLAGLRKLKGVVEDRRREIRSKCLEPYTVIEGQAKELTSLIDKPIAAIDEQVKAYEAARRREKKDAIIRYMDEAFADLPGDIAKKLQCKVYDPKWENATTAKKVWVDAIAAAHRQTVNELKILADVDEDFRDMAMQAYKVGLSLSDAQNKIIELVKQREIIRQREQQRREAEERRRAEEERRKAERERLEAERRAQKQAVKALAAERQADVRPEHAQEEKPAPTPAPAPAPAQAAPKAKRPDGIMETVIRIRGSRSQISRIFGFIRYAGADYEYEEVSA